MKGYAETVNDIELLEIPSSIEPKIEYPISSNELSKSQSLESSKSSGIDSIRRLASAPYIEIQFDSSNKCVNFEFTITVLLTEPTGAMFTNSSTVTLSSTSGGLKSNVNLISPASSSGVFNFNIYFSTPGSKAITADSMGNSSTIYVYILNLNLTIRYSGSIVFFI